MNVPEISVVMSVYNGERYLRQAADSILAQEGIEFEFIVVDDGSSDSSPRILEEYACHDPRVRVICQENAGLTRALIRGCVEARGEYIARQDADDVSLPGRLAKLADVLRRDHTLSFVSSWSQVIGPEGEVLMTHTRPEDPYRATELLLFGGAGPPGHGSVMFRRSRYEAVGGYRAEFYFAQDCDLWFRLGENGRLGYVPQVLYQYRVSPGSVSGNRNFIKVEFAEAVSRCRDARRRGENESDILSACVRLANRTRETSPASEAATLYFLGRNLLRRNPVQAVKYLVACIRKSPWHFRAWSCLAAVVPCLLISLASDPSAGEQPSDP